MPNLRQKLIDGALAVANAKDLNTSRENLKGLSRPLALWVAMSKPEGVNVVYCSMANSS